MLIKNARWILTPHKVLKQQDIYIEDGRIVEFKRQEADTVIDASEHLVMPGFINAHTHIPMTFLRGLAEDLPLKEWLEKEVWPREKKISGRLVYYASLLGMAEALASGTTTIVDMYFFQKEIARAAKESGIRAWLGYGLMDTAPGTDLAKEARKEREAREAVRRTGCGRIKPIISPHSPYTCSKELLLHSKRISEEEGLPLQIHVSETKEEVAESKQLKGKTPLKYLDSLGLLGPRTLMAHGVWLSATETVIAARRKAVLVHCPVSNLKLGSGIAPIHKYLQKGITVGLGTDGPASNNSLNMFKEMRMAALSQKLSNPQFTTRKVIEMATKNGATALDKDIGRIETGSKADLIIVNLDQPHMMPIINSEQAINNLVYCAQGSEVSHTIVNGNVVARNGKAVHVDVEKTAQHLMKEMDIRGIL